MKPVDGSVKSPLVDGKVWVDFMIPLLLWGAALVLFTLNLGGVPLRDWDEGTVAQVAREIWRSHIAAAATATPDLTWLFPTLWGEPYLNKPPLMHNVMAIAFHLGGVSEWTARLPGALLTATSVPILYGIGREVFVQRSAALLSACVYLTLLPVVRLGRLAMLDGAVLFFLGVLVWCGLRSRRDTRFALGIGLAIACISLTKGVLLGGLLGAIALLFLLWDTPRLLRQPSLWLGLGLGSIPVLGWYGAQVWHYGAFFWEGNVMNQSLQRIWNSVESNGGPPWYYLLELVKYGWPWLLFLPLALQTVWQNRELGWAKLVLVWGGVYFVAISLMATKLPWYILPLYPALALAVGAQLAGMWNQGIHIGRRQYNLGRYSRRWVWALMALAALMLTASAYLGLGETPSDPQSALLLLFLGVTFGATASLVWRQNPRFIMVLLWGMYLGLNLLVLSPSWVWELAEDYPVRPVAAIVRRSTPRGEVLYTSAPYHRPSLNFYSDRSIIPAPPERLQRIWQETPEIYLLLDADTLRQWRSLNPQILGTAQGWTLVHKPRQPFPNGAEIVQK